MQNLYMQSRKWWSFISRPPPCSWARWFLLSTVTLSILRNKTQTSPYKWKGITWIYLDPISSWYENRRLISRIPIFKGEICKSWFWCLWTVNIRSSDIRVTLWVIIAIKAQKERNIQLQCNPFIIDFLSSKICISTCLHAWVQRMHRFVQERKFTSLMLHSLTEQSSLPLANFVGHTGEKSTDQALFSCSVNWENSWPVLASHSYKCIQL